MAHCPYIYITSGARRPCIHDEDDPHNHAYTTPYTDTQHGSPVRWKLPSDFKGTALTPAVTTSNNYRSMSRAKHAHSKDGKCLKNTFVHPEDCPVVEKTDSEEEPCDYEYHRLSNHVGHVEKYPCVGKLGHEEKHGVHRYDTGDGIKREGSIRSAWHKRDHESPEEPCDYIYRHTTNSGVSLSEPCLVEGEHTQHLYRAWDGFLVSGVTPESWVKSGTEKTDSEKQPEYVAVDHRVVITINDLGTVREFKRSINSLNDAPEAMESMIRRHALKGVHILNVRVEARTVTRTAWEALG